MVMVFNVTFNNISVISWSSLLLVEETGELDKTDHSQITDKLYHIMWGPILLLRRLCVGAFVG
jgi:hypothetical protein